MGVSRQACARWWLPVVVGISGCEFTGVDDGGDDGNTRTITDDVATDFLGTITGGTIGARGAIEPDTYATRGLHARGYQIEVVTATTTYADLTPAVLGPLAGESFGLVPRAWGNDANDGRPKGLGIGRHENYTIVVDGEIELPAGDTQLQLESDDDGFIEVEIDGTVVTIRDDAGGPVGRAMVTTTRPGWYPIRGAMTERYGDAAFVISTVTAEVPTALEMQRLRAVTTHERGLITHVFFLQELELGPGLTLDRGPVDHVDLTPGPSDWALSTTFSLRYAGQLLIDTPGTYVIAVDVGADPDDGYRLFVDGELVAARWLTLAATDPAPLALTAGWHSIVVDYSNRAVPAEIHLRMGPDASTLAVIPADHLRPVVSSGAIATIFGPSATGWNDGGTASYTLAPGGFIPVPPGAIIDFIDYNYVVTGPRTGFTATIDQGGTPVPMVIHPTPNQTDLATPYDYVAIEPGFAGQPLGATWRYAVTDLGDDAQGGSISGQVIATHHGGTPAPISPEVIYVSQPHPTPGAIELGPLTVTADLREATMLLAVRTAATAAELETAAWTDVADGTIPAVIAGELVQYRITLTSDGWAMPSVDVVSLEYRVGK